MFKYWQCVRKQRRVQSSSFVYQTARKHSIRIQYMGTSQVENEVTTYAVSIDSDNPAHPRNLIRLQLITKIIYRH